MWWLIGMHTRLLRQRSLVRIRHLLQMILGHCRIIVSLCRKSQGREGNLPLRQKEDLKTIKIILFYLKPWIVSFCFLSTFKHACGAERLAVGGTAGVPRGRRGRAEPSWGCGTWGHAFPYYSFCHVYLYSEQSVVSLVC